MDMRSFVTRKLIYLAITLFAILLFNFFLFRIMPGDPAAVIVPKTGDEALKSMIRDKFHLNDPYPQQFYYYVVQVFTLDFGPSAAVWKGAPISDGLPEPIFNTVLLVGIGTALAVYLGVMLGKFAAWRRGKPADTVGMAFALVFYSMPTFLFALIMLMLFAGELQWFPLNGPYGRLPFVDHPPRYEDMSIIEKIISRGYHLVLPVIAFTIEVMAEFALIMRNSLTPWSMRSWTCATAYRRWSTGWSRSRPSWGSNTRRSPCQHLQGPGAQMSRARSMRSINRCSMIRV